MAWDGMDGWMFLLLPQLSLRLSCVVCALSYLCVYSYIYSTLQTKTRLPTKQNTNPISRQEYSSPPPRIDLDLYYPTLTYATLPYPILLRCGAGSDIIYCVDCILYGIILMERPPASGRGEWIRGVGGMGGWDGDMVSIIIYRSIYASIHQFIHPSLPRFSLHFPPPILPRPSRHRAFPPPLLCPSFLPSFLLIPPSFPPSFPPSIQPSILPFLPPYTCATYYPIPIPIPIHILIPIPIPIPIPIRLPIPILIPASNMDAIAWWRQWQRQRHSSGTERQTFLPDFLSSFLLSPFLPCYPHKMN